MHAHQAGLSIAFLGKAFSHVLGHPVGSTQGGVFGCGTTSSSSLVFVVCVPSLSVVQPLDCWSDPNGGRCAHAHLLDAHLTTRLQPAARAGCGAGCHIDMWQRWLVDAKGVFFGGNKLLHSPARVPAKSSAAR